MSPNPPAATSPRRSRSTSTVGLSPCTERNHRPRCPARVYIRHVSISLRCRSSTSFSAVITDHVQGKQLSKGRRGSASHRRHGAGAGACAAEPRRPASGHVQEEGLGAGGGVRGHQAHAVVLPARRRRRRQRGRRHRRRPRLGNEQQEEEAGGVAAGEERAPPAQPRWRPREGEDGRGAHREEGGPVPPRLLPRAPPHAPPHVPLHH